MDKFKLENINTEMPYKAWADEYADAYRKGFTDAVEGVEFSPFNATPYIEGYSIAVSVFAGGKPEYEEFIRVRGYSRIRVRSQTLPRAAGSRRIREDSSKTS